MAENNSTEQTSEDAYLYGLASSFDILANIALKTDRDSFINAAQMLDCSPSNILQSLAYASFAIEMLESNGEGGGRLMRNARSSITELNELMARLVEFQGQAEMLKEVSRINAEQT